MDTPSSQDRLLDLLYGECTPREEAELRRVLQQDEALARQWEELKAGQEAIHQAVPPLQEVPERVNEAILEAALAQAPDGGDRSNRKPTGPAGVWSALLANRAFRATLSVAVLLIGSAAVILAIWGEAIDALFIDAHDEVSAISIGGYSSPTADAPAPRSRAPAPDQAPIVVAEAVQEAIEEESEPPAASEADAEEAFAPTDRSLALLEERSESAAPARSAPPQRRSRATAIGGVEPSMPPSSGTAESVTAEIGSATPGQRFGDLPAVVAADAAAPPEDADELLAQALTAYEEGDEDQARTLVDSLFSEQLHRQLDGDRRQQAQELRDQLQRDH